MDKDASVDSEVSVVEQCASDNAAENLQLTDAGNAERFEQDHRATLRWVAEWKSWVRYDAGRWQRTPQEGLTKTAIATIRGIYDQAHASSGTNGRLALAQHVKLSEGRTRIDAMIHIGRGLLLATSEEFDADPWAFNVANGTIDLRTGKLRRHRRDDLITTMSPVKYDPSAECPQFDAFLARVLPDGRLRAWVQRYVGYCLSGDVGEQVLAFFFGAGANGKSTLIEVLLGIFADYGKTGAPDLLIAKNGQAHPTEQADLKGARLVVCQEVEAGHSWSERTVKALTGGDTVKARFMHGNFFSFKPTHKLVVAANHRPKVRGSEEAIWRRIRLVPFDVTIPPAERDPDLIAKLEQEAPGILAWAVRGCLDWQRNRLGDAPEVSAATAAYREEQDHLGHFLSGECKLVAGAFTPTSDLYARYQTWCANSGEWAMPREVFRQDLLNRPGLQDKRTAGARGIAGVQLLAVTA